VEFSILIGVALSILLFVPRPARLRAHELVVAPEGIVRERLPSDPKCTALLIYDIEGELFFGAAPEVDRHFDELKHRLGDGIRVLVLRVKRTRNPDMVFMERLQHFLHDMEKLGVTVLLCGVRGDFAQGLENLRFYNWLPSERVFLEEDKEYSATLKAVRHSYTIIENNICDHCAQKAPAKQDEEALYYMI
jgi:SulP family sulfate permease